MLQRVAVRPPGTPGAERASRREELFKESCRGRSQDHQTERWRSLYPYFAFGAPSRGFGGAGVGGSGCFLAGGIGILTGGDTARAFPVPGLVGTRTGGETALAPGRPGVAGETD